MSEVSGEQQIVAVIPQTGIETSIQAPIWVGRDYGLAAGLLALLLLCLWGTLHYYRLVRLIRALPTATTKGVFIGLIELKGQAFSFSPLRSKLAGIPCVYYSWSISEHYRRRKNDKTERGSEVIASGQESQPFFLRDQDGEIRVMPEGASIDGKSTYNKTITTSDPAYYALGPTRSISGSTGRRTFTETALPIDHPTYVLGRAQERTDIVAAEIAKPRPGEPYLISARSEDQVARGYLIIALVLAVVVPAVLLFIAYIVHVQGLKHPKGPLFFSSPSLWALGVYGILLLVGMVLTMYNSLVDLANRTRHAWSLIDIQLKRRADLIPQLVRTVEAARDHEGQTQELVALLRAEAALPTQNASHHAALPIIRRLEESYPDLKAQEQFGELRNQLVDSEHRIALARDYYNMIATHQRTLASQFPDFLLFRLGKFPRPELWSASEFERETIPKMALDNT